MDLKDVDEYYEREAGPVWRELRGGLWHRTGSHLFRQILKDGEIKPNPDLQPGEFKWAELGTTYSRDVGGVSLFDFDSTNWIQIRNHAFSVAWPEFLRAPPSIKDPNTWLATIWISLDRALATRVVSPKEVIDDWKTGDLSRTFYPWAEACYRGPIPLSVCDGAIIVCAVKPSEFRRVPLHPLGMAKLERLEADWRECFADDYEARVLSGTEKVLRAFKSLNTSPAAEAGRDLTAEIEEGRRRAGLPPTRK